MRCYVIVYDISDDRRRKKLGDFLERYGVRVNRSVFEATFKTHAEYEYFRQKLDTMLDLRADSLRIYHLCAACIGKSDAVCKESGVFAENSFFYF